MSLRPIPRTLRNAVLGAWIAVTGVAAIAGLGSWVSDLDAYVEMRGLAALRISATLACLAALGLGWRRRRELFHGEPARVGLALRGGSHALLLSFACATATRASGDDGRAAASVFGSVAALAAAGWTSAAILRPGSLFAAPRGAVAALDLMAANLALLLVLSEALVLGWARLNPSPFLWNESSIRAHLDANRLPPLQSFRGGPVNSGGYPDDEFFRAGEDDFVVAVLTDSFGLSAPTRAHHFTTRLERTLIRELGTSHRRVAVHNFGVASIGMPEYAWLLEREVLPTRPSVVLLCVFVGNDIRSTTEKRGPPLYFQQWTTYEVFRRALRVGAARQRAAPGSALAGNGRAAQPMEPPPPGHEPPSFDEAEYLAIELDRLTVTCPDRCPGDRRVRRRWPLFWGALDAIHVRAGSRLRVVIIPDEFQVDDALWSRLMDIVGESARYERTLPQRRLRAWGRERGVPILDLLPVLSSAHREAPTYHLRDTHWNARGNQLAGDAIAAFLLAEARHGPRLRGG